jgi:hypothetical protein
MGEVANVIKKLNFCNKPRMFVHGKLFVLSLANTSLLQKLVNYGQKTSVKLLTDVICECS